MRSAFAILGLQPRPRISQEELHDAFLREAVRFHPDTSREKAAAERFQEIQAAHQRLQDPVENLRVFLETHGAPDAFSGGLAQLPEDLLRLFTRASPLRETWDALHARLASAQTGLARALLERELAAWRLEAAPVIRELEEAWDARQRVILFWEEGPEKADFTPLYGVLRDLKFLQKWRAFLLPNSAANQTL
jgi:curved DNA-binding protein CbpA